MSSTTAPAHENPGLAFPPISKKRPIKSPKAQKLSRKDRLHHPHLNMIMYEIANSPYRTPPVKSYPEDTLKLNDKVNEIRRSFEVKAKPIGDSPETRQKDFVVDDVTKKIFMDEVVYFRTVYKVLRIHYISFFITDIAVPRREFQAKNCIKRFYRQQIVSS